MIHKQANLVRDIYDLRADIDFDNEPQHIKNDVIEIIKHSIPKNKICDVGCGRGFLLKRLSEQGYNDITGIDISAKQIAIARENLNNTNANLFCTSIFDFNIQQTYDLVVSTLSCVGQFSKLGDKAFFSSIKKLLNQKGIFYLTTFTKEKALNNCGNFKTSYSKSKKQIIESKVSISTDQKYLVIEQNVFENNKIIFTIAETVLLYSISELTNLMTNCGFSRVQTIENSVYYSSFVAS